MAINKYKPHVLMIPEDDADRQMANGFLLDPLLFSQRIQVLEEAGGWARVLDVFESDHIAGMESWPLRFVVLVIDFDDQETRLASAKSRIPANLSERVFIIGSLTNPERLRQELGRSYEAIGQALAQDCRENTGSVWSHDLLKHNSR